jgi:hypothetical protein
MDGQTTVLGRRAFGRPQTIGFVEKKELIEISYLYQEKDLEEQETRHGEGSI